MIIRPRRIALTLVLAFSAVLSSSANVVESTGGVFSAASERVASNLSLATSLREQPRTAVSAPVATVIEDPFAPSLTEQLAQLRAQRAAAAVVEAKANQPQFAAVPTPQPVAVATNYVGKNHLWIPALGISANWKLWGCASSAGLPNGLFVWTCSGANNTYYVAHNSSTFRPIWSAYHAGKLGVGMIAITADAQGVIHRWRLAYAVDMDKYHEVYDRSAETVGATSGPVLTMQTCLDPLYQPSTRFIIVRWVPAD